jgi:hypothetical protein
MAALVPLVLALTSVIVGRRATDAEQPPARRF